jgi:RES domain-containing protein
MRTSSCRRLVRRPLTGHWFRAIRLENWRTRLSSEHSRVFPSRFSAASPSTPLHRIVHFGATHQVSLHEVGCLVGDPNAPVSDPRGSWAILSIAVVLDQVVDLTDRSQQQILRTNESELTGNWLNYPGVPPTQEIGQALYDLPELEGLIYRSSKVNARCLAVFPDKLGPRSTLVFQNGMTGKPERLI